LPRYQHIILHEPAETARYTATNSGGAEFPLPPRNRAMHAGRLLGAVQQAQAARGQFPRQIGSGFYESPGLTLTFESDPGFPLAFESLDLPKSKIQLLSVTKDNQGRSFATVHVPDDKLQVLLKKLETYRDHEKNRKLAESIANIKLATLRELWTDDDTLYPAANTVITWEVWLRYPVSNEQSPVDLFRNAAADFGYEVTSEPLTFVDRTVLLARGSREQLAHGVDVLGIIAEVRKAKITTDFFTALSPAEQFEWSDDLLKRLVLPEAGAPAIGLLDTGVNRAHALLTKIISDADAHTLKPAWGSHDTHPTGHGTQMAGLAIYGDLTHVLADHGPIAITHGVQSLKLIHKPDPHQPDLYGTVTIEGVSRLEIDATKRRIYCMAITTDGRDRGRPSSWSATIDNLACGAINDTRRLIIISAGNVEPDDHATYPDCNETASIQDPAQAWNALTVGGYTDKIFISASEHPGWTPLAAQGDLAPSSTTSMTWPRSLKVPFKPDIVMEAGNMGVPPGGGTPDYPDELQLLTTNHQFTAGRRPFSTFQDTSAAAALASNLAAKLHAGYPQFTPETLRGFMVHSAYWTEAMKKRATDDHGKIDMVRLLRTFGHGVPNPERLFYSASNSLTLIMQDTLQPFFRDAADNGRIKTCDIKFHALPWPEEALLALPLDVQAQMRVTLSYFIEPSPGERGWDRKYGYPSHGLRFKVIRATETVDEFKLRINAFDREDDYDETHAGETGMWDFGVTGLTNGSIHSNTWHGTAAELARRGHIAVHPTLGWWRTRTREKRYDRGVHYSLIVTISTPSEAIDIYTPVANKIGIEIPAE
jgi:subtilase family protein